MNKYSKEIYNFLSSIWKSFAVGLCSRTDKEKSVWAATPIRAFGRGFTLVELLVVVLAESSAETNAVPATSPVPITMARATAAREVSFTLPFLSFCILPSKKLLLTEM